MKLRIKAIRLIKHSRYDKGEKLNVTRIFAISFLYIFLYFLLTEVQDYFA